MLSIAGQIQKSLNDIDRILAQIPYAIYPDINSRIITTNTRYRQSGTMGAVGIAGFIATGVLSLPFIVGSAVNIWNTYKMDKELEEIEKRKINLYVNQAIDSFNHFMQVMIPYFIDEVNHSLFNTFKQTAQFYRNLDDLDVAKIELIERISYLYTIKQLSVNNAIIEPKKLLIEKIQAAVNIDINKFKVI